MKKNLLVALLSVSTLTVLTGCGSKKDEVVVKEETTTTVETTPEATRDVTPAEEAK